MTNIYPNDSDVKTYTGFNDKNNNQIFTKDIVKYMENEYEVYINPFLGQYCITGDTGETVLFQIYKDCEKIK